MFSNGNHLTVAPLLNVIGASVAIIEPADHDLSLVSANDRFEDFCDRPVLDIVEKKLNRIFPRYMANEIGAGVREVLRTGQSSESEIVTDFEGAIHWWRCVFAPIFDSKQSVVRIMLTAIDITEKYMLQKELEISHQRFEAVVNSAYEGIISVDKNQQIQLMNDAAKEMFGYSEADICKINLRSLIPKKYHDKHDGYVETFKQSPVKSRPMHQRSEVTGVRRDGSEFPVDITIAKIHVDDKLELTAVVRDLSEKLSLISELQKAASHDELTGIFNRRQLVIELEREFERYHRFGNGFSIALLDLDHFKSINDKLGHIAGDKVLQHFSENVKKELRSVDIFGRWGGEEFLLVLPEADMDKSQRILQRIKQRLQKEPFDSQDESIVIKFSAGLTTINTDTSTLESLIKKVDKALYQAKDEGRDRIVVAS